MKQREHYVYLCRVDGEPRYVGVGTKDRDTSHIVKANRINAGCSTKHISGRWPMWLAKQLAIGASVTTERLAEGLTLTEAHALEVEWIARFGRLDFEECGTLLNFYSGGFSDNGDAVRRAQARPSYRLSQLRAAMERRERQEKNLRLYAGITKRYQRVIERLASEQREIARQIEAITAGSAA